MSYDVLVIVPSYLISDVCLYISMLYIVHVYILMHI